MPSSMHVSSSPRQLPVRLLPAVNTWHTWLPDLPQEKKKEYGELTPAVMYLGLEVKLTTAAYNPLSIK